MYYNGKLIVFEGPDGTGKTTLSQQLVRELKRHGQDCKYHSFPGRERGSLGALVYGLHHDSRHYGVESIDPTSVQLLHVAAHVDAIKRHIKPKLTQGQTVVLDRFWWSTWVYGLMDGICKKSLQNILDVEIHEWSGITPDVVFFLSRETPIGEEVPMHRFTELRASYLELAKTQESKYPVEYVENSKLVEDSLVNILDTLLELQNDPLRSRKAKPGTSRISVVKARS